ncbi:hypothetical protein GUJ93_ZPchr0010g10004 [Zizania palustris]|uniref:Uncharacterized protein n=1 Tax=Zizania palustris TaxID=103762 RepID=A0A8J6BIA5_ZIZPA|nr:hypothetical protein GUJ93_ZPchr0010g10004 [Zizania palustris]
MDWPPDGASAGGYCGTAPAAAPVVPVDFTVVKKRLGGGGGMEARDASGSPLVPFGGAATGGGRSLLNATGVFWPP